MSAISGYIQITIDIADMKHDEIPLMPQRRIDEAQGIGAKLARLRVARRIRQIDAAARAGLARSTAALIEKGDPGRTLAQVLRYLEAIAPNLSLLDLLQESDPSLKALIQAEATRRVRLLSSSELKELDF
jgi:transcriptional regulator with XRE-family HTH domain